MTGEGPMKRGKIAPGGENLQNLNKRRKDRFVDEFLTESGNRLIGPESENQRATQAIYIFPSVGSFISSRIMKYDEKRAKSSANSSTVPITNSTLKLCLKSLMPNLWSIPYRMKETTIDHAPPQHETANLFLKGSISCLSNEPRY